MPGTRPNPEHTMYQRPVPFRHALPSVALALLFLTACAPAEDPAPMTEDEAAVVAVVESLFEAMRTNDGEMAAAVFHPEARMGRRTEDGELTFGSPDGFVAAVGRPKDQVWDEPIWDWTVNVDDRVAQMWTKYAFYLDGEFSHCGIDAFDLHKTSEGWKVTQLVDTRRQEDCWLPPGRTDDG